MERYSQQCHIKQNLEDEIIVMLQLFYLNHAFLCLHDEELCYIVVSIFDLMVFICEAFIVQ